MILVVRDVAPFRADPDWIHVFGEVAIVQRPDAMVGAPLRTDGSRVDLRLLPVAAMSSYQHEEPAEGLFDRDGVAPPPPPPNAPHHVPEPPTDATFADADPAHGWAALEATTELFRSVAVEVARRFELDDPWSDDARVMMHLRRAHEASLGVAGRATWPPR